MSVIGIHIHYCEDGQHKQMWLDVDVMQAISWTAGDVDSKPPGPGGPNPIPIGEPPKPGPDPCKDMANGGEPFCWWNGSDWVCGSL
jgi:hypothetical protein